MSATVNIRSPVGHISGPAATRPPCFIETSGEINEFVKMHVINLAEHGLQQVGKRLFGAKSTVRGFACKKNINKLQKSPAIKNIVEHANLEANVQFIDPCPLLNDKVEGVLLKPQKILISHPEMNLDGN